MGMLSFHEQYRAYCGARSAETDDANGMPKTLGALVPLVPVEVPPSPNAVKLISKNAKIILFMLNPFQV